MLDKTVGLTEANKSHYGNKKIRTHESLSSSRTIDKSRMYEDNGDFCKIQSIRVNPRAYAKSSMIFDHVVSKSVDTDRKMTGCSRSHYLKNNLSNFKLHYEDNEMNTVNKMWQSKKKTYGKLRDLMLKGNVDEYYHKYHTKSNKTKPKKFKQDFASSITNVPGSNLGKRKEKNEEIKPSRKKMNDVCSSVTYKQPMAAKMYYSNQQTSASSLSTMHTQADPVARKTESKANPHRYQFKRVNRLKYKN